MATLGPSFRFMLPPRSFFHLPPDPNPAPLAPATNEPTFRAPFAINQTFYESALSAPVPITFAIVYMTFVSLANRYNRRNGNKPFAISKTRALYYFTIVHNITLAVYSALTFVGMIRALYASVASPLTASGIPGTLDSLCKMSGPRGPGSAVTYDARRSSWRSRNSLVQLAYNGLTPDTTDRGRIWNEGLSFWGFLFYLSKFYEVVDTLLILAKGKRSATLQTYHHAGAMLSMWAGIRYMSAPIWLFVLLNSGIHTLMYVYYTLHTLQIKVPQQWKRALTTMQISQFIVGIVYATLHLFLYYTVPITFAYTINQAATGAAGVAASSAPSLVTSPSAWPHIGKQAVALLAGAPGVAQRMNEGYESEGFGASSKSARDTIRYGTDYEEVHCLDTSGQAFAIWLNVLYLAPLTALFVRFFVKAYAFGAKPAGKDAPGGSEKPRTLSTSVDAAARKTSDTVETLGLRFEQSIDSVTGEIQKGGDDLHVQEDLKRIVQELKDGANSAMGHDNGQAIVEDEDDGEIIEKESQEKDDPEVKEEVQPEDNPQRSKEAPEAGNEGSGDDKKDSSTPSAGPKKLEDTTQEGKIANTSRQEKSAKPSEGQGGAEAQAQAQSSPKKSKKNNKEGKGKKESNPPAEKVSALTKEQDNEGDTPSEVLKRPNA